MVILLRSLHVAGKYQSCFDLPDFQPGLFLSNFWTRCFRKPAASFRVDTRSNGCRSCLRLGGLSAMTLKDLTQMFSTDEQCRALLKKLRWPYGVECLRCKSKKVFELADYGKFECIECHYQFKIGRASCRERVQI